MTLLPQGIPGLCARAKVVPTFLSTLGVLSPVETSEAFIHASAGEGEGLGGEEGGIAVSSHQQLFWQSL